MVITQGKVPENKEVKEYLGWRATCVTEAQRKNLVIDLAESFGEKEYPRPAAVIVNYTGLSEVSGNEPPTYSAVGTSDYIADYRTMERRIEAIQRNVTDAQIEVFKGLSHGFGLGTGTAAEGWIDHAIAFWERNMKY